MERYGQHLPSRRQMKQQQGELANSLDLAKQSSKVRFHELSTALEVMGSVDVGTYPRLVNVTPIGNHKEI